MSCLFVFQSFIDTLQLCAGKYYFQDLCLEANQPLVADFIEQANRLNGGKPDFPGGCGANFYNVVTKKYCSVLSAHRPLLDPEKSFKADGGNPNGMWKLEHLITLIRQAQENTASKGAAKKSPQKSAAKRKRGDENNENNDENATWM
ncbi:hypothetical protein N8602_00185 [bacterium]|nr:hypothetical protein [bacterium]